MHYSWKYPSLYFCCRYPQGPSSGNHRRGRPGNGWRSIITPYPPSSAPVILAFRFFTFISHLFCNFILSTVVSNIVDELVGYMEKIFIERKYHEICNFPCKKCDTDFLLSFNLVENDTESDGNSIIFWANAMEIPWLEVIQNSCHVPAWKKLKPGQITWDSRGIWC